MKRNLAIEKLAEIFHENKFARMLFRKIYQKMYAEKRINIQSRNFRNNARETLLKFNEALDSVSCDYWLSFGTLLGAIRENGFIGHDWDIDVGVMGISNKEQICEVLLQKGFKKVRSIVAENLLDAYEETYEYMDVLVDIFYFSAAAHRTIFCYDFVYGKRDSSTNNIYFIPRKITFPFEGLTKYEFMGLEVKIPRNYDEYLRVHYGDNYLIPNPNWDTLSSTAAEIFFNERALELVYK